MDIGTKREFLWRCPTGAALNHVQKRLRPRTDEADADYAERVWRKLRQIEGTGRCTSYQTCAACPKGKELLADEETQEGRVLNHHVDTLLGVLGDEGPDRSLPAVCSVGSEIRRLLASDGPLAGILIQSLDNQYGCSSHPSCLCCPLGQDIYREALIDLSENGMEGDYGSLLKETYAYLW